MDIGAITPKESAENGAELKVLHPTTHEHDGWVITLRGADSPTFRRYLAAAERKNASRKKKVTRAEADALMIEALVGLTIDWKGLTQDGEDVPFSPEKAEELYSAHDWLVEQINEFVSNRGNFLKAS